MSLRQRLTFAAIAALIAVVAVVVLTAGGGESEEEASAPAATATATATATAEPGAQSTPSPEPTREPTPEPERIRVRGGEVVGGPKELRFEEGERARFVIVTDVPEEIHVHGFDVYRDVGPGKPARFDFKADITGIFEVELHGSGLQVASLRVEP